MTSLHEGGVLPPIDDDLTDLFRDLFAASGSESHGRLVDLDAAQWAAIVEAGLDRLTSPHGAEASWLEAAALLRFSAAAGAAIPYAENDLIAGWAADAAGLPVIDGLSTLGFVDDAGTAPAVPWASDSDAIVLVREGESPWIARVARADADVVRGHDLAGAPRDVVQVRVAEIERRPVGAAFVRELRCRAKLARLVQTAAALERAVEMSVVYATDRVQFGRPIAKFQAVQALLADAAGESQLARITTDTAVLALLSEEVDVDELELVVGVAASVVAHATSVVVRNAHQVHGAIGTTLEHDLRRVTGPALAWRDEYGSVGEWEVLVDRRLRDGRESVWETVVRAGAPLV